MKELDQTAYLAPPGLDHLLANELKDITHRYGRLIVAKGPLQPVLWWRNIWLNPVLIPIKSISDAKKALCGIQRNWWPYAFAYHRRTQLIQAGLPFVSAKPLDFLQAIPKAPLGSWMLIDEETILASPNCLSPMPNGEYVFNEDKINPPSRAYLKLWEFFTRFGIAPNKTDICIDLGASPGGWTYVLSQLAKQVIAYDRSALDPRLMALKNVSFKAQDAFKVKLSADDDIDWVFSDVICFPERMFNFINYLLKEAPDKKYVITIKFRGSDHGEVISRFKTLPGHLVHLSHHKHELAWYKIE